MSCRLVRTLRNCDKIPLSSWGQLPLDFSKPPPQRPRTSNAVGEVPPTATSAKVYDRIDLDARMQQDKCRGRAWKETVWPVNVDSTAARIRGSGELASFSQMDAAYAKALGVSTAPMQKATPSA